MAIPSYKIVLVGNYGVGKTAFVKRIRTGDFQQKYIATQGVDVCPLTLTTNYGDIIFKIWDCAGQEKFGGLRDGYYMGAQGAILMIDLSAVDPTINASNWIQSIKRVTNEIPLVVCGNKSDLPNKEIGIDGIVKISVKSGQDIKAPLLELARKITGHEDLMFL